LFICQHAVPAQGRCNWHDVLKQGIDKGVIHSKRTHKNLVDCWRCVLKGSYTKSFGIDEHGLETKPQSK
jgi:hypothetical protein